MLHSRDSTNFPTEALPISLSLPSEKKIFTYPKTANPFTQNNMMIPIWHRFRMTNAYGVYVSLSGHIVALSGACPREGGGSKGRLPKIS